MSTAQTGSGAENADRVELDKFEALARGFWNPHGEFRPLHILNPVRAQFVAERASLTGARVLDVGCGGGLLAESLARAGADVTAIDLAPTMIEVARRHASEQGLAIDYRVLGAEALAATQPRTFDVVTCMEMLEHVPDPESVVGACARLLKPGGWAFFSTINRNARSFMLAIVAAEHVLRLLPRGTHEYERLIRPSELARWARACSLSLGEIAGLEFQPLTGHCRLSRDPSVNYLAHFRKEGTA